MLLFQRGLLPMISWFIYLPALFPPPVSQWVFWGWVWLTGSLPASNLTLFLK